MSGHRREHPSPPPSRAYERPPGSPNGYLEHGTAPHPTDDSYTSNRHQRVASQQGHSTTDRSHTTDESFGSGGRGREPTQRGYSTMGRPYPPDDSFARHERVPPPSQKGYSAAQYPHLTDNPRVLTGHGSGGSVDETIPLPRHRNGSSTGASGHDRYHDYDYEPRRRHIESRYDQEEYRGHHDAYPRPSYPAGAYHGSSSPRTVRSPPPNYGETYRASPPPSHGYGGRPRHPPPAYDGSPPRHRSSTSAVMRRTPSHSAHEQDATLYAHTPNRKRLLSPQQSPGAEPAVKKARSEQVPPIPGATAGVSYSEWEERPPSATGAPNSLKPPSETTPLHDSATLSGAAAAARGPVIRSTAPEGAAAPADQVTAPAAVKKPKPPPRPVYKDRDDEDARAPSGTDGTTALLTTIPAPDSPGPSASKGKATASKDAASKTPSGAKGKDKAKVHTAVDIDLTTSPDDQVEPTTAPPPKRPVDKPSGKGTAADPADAAPSKPSRKPPVSVKKPMSFVPFGPFPEQLTTDQWNEFYQRRAFFTGTLTAGPKYLGKAQGVHELHVKAVRACVKAGEAATNRGFLAVKAYECWGDELDPGVKKALVNAAVSAVLRPPDKCPLGGSLEPYFAPPEVQNRVRLQAVCSVNPNHEEVSDSETEREEKRAKKRHA